VLGSGAAKQDAMDALIAELRPSFG